MLRTCCFCGAKHRHKHSLFLCWPFPSCWGRAGIDTDKILKITRTSGAFDCNQCKLAHNSYICLPKILKWRIMDVVIFLGCEKTVSRVRRSFTFVGLSLIGSLSYCLLGSWFKVRRPPKCKIQCVYIGKKRKSSIGFFFKILNCILKKFFQNHKVQNGLVTFV